MSFRQHQKQIDEMAEYIASGANGFGYVKEIIAAVSPGAGKSALPVILAAKLIPSFAQRVCWIVPRVALQQQAESAFTDAGWRSMLNHNHLIRVSTNEADPCRGLSGFTTTYAAVAASVAPILAEFQRRRFILVLDENHHISTDAAVRRNIEPLVKSAALTLFMSGTLERGRGEKIAFLDYARGVDKDRLSLCETPTRKVITYSRASALCEKAVIPIRFTFLDIKAKWREGTSERSVETLKGVKRKIARKALFTALQTQYALDLLNAAVESWEKRRESYAGAKLLVVAPTQVLARKYCEHISRVAFETKAGLATVNEGQKALKAIKDFKEVGGMLTVNRALVTVGMAYEGLDVKEITHIACLTRIRSKPWIEQMLARATRFDPKAGPWETQEAHVFLPDDPDMHKLIAAIKREQAPFAKHFGHHWGNSEGNGGQLFPDLVPIDSGVSGRRLSKIAPKAEAPRELTPSERESSMRDSIESHVRSFAVRKGVSVKRVNTQLISRFGKSRTIMRLEELEKALVWVRGNLK